MSHEHAKIITYVEILNRIETIEFKSNTSSEDLKGLLIMNPF